MSWERIIKKDWKERVGELVSLHGLADKIYDIIAREYGFDGPTKEDINKYLKSNYKQHPVYGNYWEEI